MPIPSILSLDVNNWQDCVTINIIDDMIVEGTEIFEVEIVETDENQIQITGVTNILVYILDNEGNLQAIKSFYLNWSLFLYYKYCFP